MHPTRTHLAAALLLASVALAGCAEQSPKPKPAPSVLSTPKTSSPTATPTGPPVMPAAAKANTEAGAKAFIQYYFEVQSYALASGDYKLLKRLSTPRCEFCDSVIRGLRKIYAAGGRVSGRPWVVLKFERSEASRGYFRYKLQLKEPAGMFVDHPRRAKKSVPRK